MKRIILCSDGTWNRPGITDMGTPVKSNVELIFNCIPGGNDNMVKQLKFYETGVGSSVYDKLDNILGGIKGFGIDDKIKNLYSFLVLNYEPEDEIFLFGFSRGAYTVRSVAGFILTCGILKPENIHLIDKAYELYRDRNDYTKPSSDYMTAFRSKYAIEDISPVKFIGVWDTVGSLGIPLSFYRKHNAAKYKFHDVKLGTHIEHAYHAVAVDERRSSFQPTLWELSKDSSHQKVEQRWFSGVHCNIGGGYKETGLSDLALNWMIEKARNAGLTIDCPSLLNNEFYNYKPSYSGQLRNSLKHIFKLLPTTRRSISLEERAVINNKQPGKVITRETIDDSVIERFNDPDLRYKPANLKQLMQLYAKQQAGIQGLL